MSELRARAPRRRADFLAARGVLLIVREPPAPLPAAPGQPAAVSANPAEGPEIFLACWSDGSVTALCGHVDLGTGLATALTQIVAEELSLAPERVHMLLGSTAAAPNQGATIASASIQIHAQPLRQAAAQAQAWLAAHGWPAPDGAAVTLALDPAAPLKAPSEFRLVGQSLPRVDLPAKMLGEASFVHDLRLPGMLHGRLVRPPYAGADHGAFVGRTLEAVDESSVAHIPGVRAVVVIGDFIAIAAEREEQAEAAMRQLAVRWKPWPGMPGTEDLAAAVRANPATARRLVDEGQVDAALAAVTQRLDRQYLWPYQMHASIGPSCAVAQWLAAESDRPARLSVWAGTQNPHVLRADLALLTGLRDVDIEVIRLEAAGCYGRNGADDVAADAALLARALPGLPVRVQLTREQEHAWEPKGAAQLMQVRGGLADGGQPVYDYETSYPSNGAPTLALLLTGAVPATAQAYEMGDRTARPPYAYRDLRVTVNDMPPIVRASWLRGVSALPSSFAHESYADELAAALGEDPVAFRLRHLDDPRAAELVQATAARAQWQQRTAARLTHTGDWAHGQGFAYARYVHSKWPGFGAAWSAWVADVDVNRVTGEVQVRRVVGGHDAGLLINPAGATHQVHGNVVQTTSRALKERVGFAPRDAAALAAAGAPRPGVDPAGVVTSREWGAYPILSFREVPVIEVLHMPRPGEAPLGVGESSSVPGTAAIANAIFDATGLRLRSPPFTPEVVRAALHEQASGGAPPSTPAAAPSASPGAPAGRPSALAPDAPLPAPASWPRRLGWLAAGALGLLAGLLGWKSAIAPVHLRTPAAYDGALVERGRVLAQAGNCVHCHTAEGGAPLAGGRSFDTPFGTVQSGNLTPDAATGIGLWSFTAFQRALREGLSRDGRHLLPAFPYTAFAKLGDDDLLALHAYLMSQPAVRAPAPVHALRFPANVPAFLAGWNGAFHDPRPWQPDPARAADWNRGAYLVQGLGHCGACHTPRNALGAERGGAAFLAGAFTGGWEAPALTALSRAPVPWSEQALFDYLRHGVSREHGSASGPMAAVVGNLAELPDADLRAMAVYLASFNAPNPQGAADAAARVQSAAARAPLPGPAQRLFEGACAACHHDGDGPRLLGANVPLALNTNLHASRPDNLLRVILEGVQAPPSHAVGFMPGFGQALSDIQIAELAAWMRARYAPDQPAWNGLTEAVRQARESVCKTCKNDS